MKWLKQLFCKHEGIKYFGGYSRKKLKYAWMKKCAKCGKILGEVEK